ncbi:MAG: sugar phosphate nucleotidyltransferase [Chloroflexota bacterium]
MDAVILAAGYVTRPQPHVRTTPKPLLPIAGRPVIELLVAKLADSASIETIYIITNDRYLEQFQAWKDDFVARLPSLNATLVLWSDGTNSPTRQKGAVGDLDYVHGRRNSKEPLLVIAGDNYFEFSIDAFLSRYRELQQAQLAAGNQPPLSLIALTDLKEVSNITGRVGVASLNPTRQITAFSEKPTEPTSTLASTLCYVLSSDALNRLGRYVNLYPNAHAAGQFIEYLLNQGHPLFGYTFDEAWFDVGDYSQYRTLNQTHLHRRLQGEAAFSHVTEAIILFADIIGASTISEHASEEDYDAFISEFQDLALTVVNSNLDRYQFTEEDRAFCEFSVRGDELVLLLYTRDQIRDLRAATSIAIELKRRCFLSSFNKRRRGKLFYDVGIGIHAGNVILRRHPSIAGSPRTFNAEGYAINLTKRIEGYSREGSLSRILMSKRIRDIAPPQIILSDRINAPLKGIYGSYALYELIAYGDIEDPENVDRVEPIDIDYHVAALESSPYDIWLALMVARYYYDEEEYSTADNYYRDVTEIYRDFAIGYMYRGRSMYRQNKPLEAREMLVRACELDPLSGKAHHFMAVALRRLGQYEAALDHHERATKYASGTSRPAPFEFNAFAYSIAESYPQFVAKGYNLDKARAYLDRAQKELGSDVTKYEYLLEHTRGVIEMRSGQLEEALRSFHSAIECINGDRSISPRKREEKLLELHYHLGEATAMERSSDGAIPSERKSEALRLLRKSLESSAIEGEDAPVYYWFQGARNLIGQLEGK